MLLNEGKLDHWLKVHLRRPARPYNITSIPRAACQIGLAVGVAAKWRLSVRNRVDVAAPALTQGAVHACIQLVAKLTLNVITGSAKQYAIVRVM